jgi:hypothetical protein
MLLGLFEWLVGTLLASVAESTWCHYTKYHDNFPAIERFALPFAASHAESIGLVMCALSICFGVAALRSQDTVLSWVLASAILLLCTGIWSAVLVYGAWLSNKWC